MRKLELQPIYIQVSDNTAERYDRCGASVRGIWDFIIGDCLAEKRETQS